MATETAKDLTWSERIAIAINEGSFTLEDQQAADNWYTCAIGFMPRDRELHSLGSQFAGAVYDNEFEEATEILHRIEELKAKGVN